MSHPLLPPRLAARPSPRFPKGRIAQFDVPSLLTTHPEPHPEPQPAPVPAAADDSRNDTVGPPVSTPQR